MTIRDQIAGAVVQAFDSDRLGEEVLYNSVPVQAIFRKKTDPTSGRAGSAAVGVLQVMVADVPTWAVNDQVQVFVGGVYQLWKVKGEVETSTWYKHVLRCERDRRINQ